MQIEDAHRQAELAGPTNTGRNFDSPQSFGQPKLLKEDIRHVLVVMLTGVHQRLLDAHTTRKGGYDGRCFHEVGSCADDVKGFHRELTLLPILGNSSLIHFDLTERQTILIEFLGNFPSIGALTSAKNLL